MFELHFFFSLTEWKLTVPIFIHIEEKYKQKATRGYIYKKKEEEEENLLTLKVPEACSRQGRLQS